MLQYHSYQLQELKYRYYLGDLHSRLTSLLSGHNTLAPHATPRPLPALDHRPGDQAHHSVTLAGHAQDLRPRGQPALRG